MCARAWTGVPRRTTTRCCPTLAGDVCAFTCNVCTSVDGCTPAYYDKALPDISRRCVRLWHMETQVKGSQLGACNNIEKKSTRGGMTVPRYYA